MGTELRALARRPSRAPANPPRRGPCPRRIHCTAPGSQGPASWRSGPAETRLHEGGWNQLLPSSLGIDAVGMQRSRLSYRWAAVLAAAVVCCADSALEGTDDERVRSDARAVRASRIHVWRSWRSRTKMTPERECVSESTETPHPPEHTPLISSKAHILNKEDWNHVAELPIDGLDHLAVPDQAAEFLLAMDLTVLLQVRSRDSRAAPGRQQLAAFAWPRLLSRTGFFLFQVFILIHTMSCIQQPRSCAFAMPLGVMLRPCPRSSVLTCRANSLAPRCWKTLPCRCFTRQ